MKANQRTTSHGFTLIELLVSMVITTIIITILVTVTVTSLDIWNRSRSEVRASLQSKAMVESMAADFESMVVRSGNNFQWLIADCAQTSDGPNGNKSPSALDLIFFSAATDRYDGKVGDPTVDKGGDISSIGYKLVYKDPIGDDSQDKFKTFVLYRKIVNPKHTFNYLLGQITLKNAFDNLPDDPDETAVDQDIDANKNFVCENIYQFTIKFHVDISIPDPNDGTKTIISHSSFTLKDGEQLIITGNGLTPPSSASQLAGGRLTAVEVSLTVLTDGGIRQLRGRNFSSDEKLSDFIAENSFQYSKLIPVPSY